MVLIYALVSCGTLILEVVYYRLWTSSRKPKLPVDRDQE